MEKAKLDPDHHPTCPAPSGEMRILRKRSGIGDLLIDLNPRMAQRLGPLGLSMVTGACGAFVAWAILRGFAQAGLLQRGLTVLDLPVVMGALFGARAGWRAWSQAFGGQEPSKQTEPTIGA